MTSDAKVGLLLGLVFIVIIAFLINGLPGIISNGTPTMAVDTSVRSNGDSLGLMDKVSKAANRVSEFDPLKIEKRDSGINLATNKDSRFIDNKAATKKANTGSSYKINSVSTKNSYIVKSGDSLGRIAIKYYGAAIGNKQATVDLIFQANSNILSYPDDIAIGQKLIMPSLGGSELQPDNKRKATARKSNEDKLMETGLFEKVGRAIKNIVVADKKRTSPLSVYTVKDGDSLWEIASKRLGSGARYREIIKLNNSIIKAADDLAPNMKLKLPHK